MAGGRARLAIGRGVSVWVLDAPDGLGESGFHAHHAIQVTVCLSGHLALATTDNCVRAGAIAVAPDIQHRIDARGLLAFVFIEPESPAGRALGAGLFADNGLVALDRPGLEPAAWWQQALDRGHSDADLLDRGLTLATGGIPVRATSGCDPRIDRIIRHSADQLNPSLGAAAAACGVNLSPSRLRHLFVEQTGLAYKTYLLWVRLTKALDVYATGASLTEAAHAAGFADSAHFSRVFKRTFGSPATTLTRV
ncbi:AraC family transcriptional regulator [Novosphingobium flavum]|uniref:AraC family transcriptional regulator n=1 Tax=Novosphingobium flavum TaxID=1778672 RepID=A0A7X1FP32_9SPHN|nr:helix-turn-helix domain-containing protein [Novosphingobium flavum]MBC2664340.1 AraC family transcriptional regulator [Novosphingobium flavum]